mmetsp:Transcript_163293/g.396879  ORF Transcript_163293/g.396879 Transcript_163293/m.396879 type:complete len:476 (-) Transcript_163293:10-1437(-)
MNEVFSRHGGTDCAHLRLIKSPWDNVGGIIPAKVVHVLPQHLEQALELQTLDQVGLEEVLEPLLDKLEHEPQQQDDRVVPEGRVVLGRGLQSCECPQHLGPDQHLGAGLRYREEHARDQEPLPGAHEPVHPEEQREEAVAAGHAVEEVLHGAGRRRPLGLGVGPALPRPLAAALRRAFLRLLLRRRPTLGRPQGLRGLRGLRGLGALRRLLLRRAPLLLVRHEAGVRSTLPGDELRVGAALDDAALAHDDDLVRPAHRGQPVGDDQSRPAGHEPLESLLDQALRLVVQGACCLVQDHQTRTPQHRARYCDPLLLATRERLAAAADLSVQTFWEVHGERRNVRRPGRLLDLCFTGQRVAIHDVLTNGPPKELRLLLNVTDLLSQPPGLQGPQVMTVKADAASLHIVEALQQSADRCLAASAPANQCGEGSGRYFNGDTLQDTVVRSRRIGKLHALQGQAALCFVAWNLADLRGDLH